MELILAAAIAALCLVLILAAVALERARRRDVIRIRLQIALEGERARVEALELEAEQHRTSPLIGRTVVANTPKPDDQAIRGVVIRELEGSGLLLAGAVYLEPQPGSRGGDVREVPAGDVVVPRVSWVQLLSITQEG